MADILSNPKARRDYHVLDTFEAGIVFLVGEPAIANRGPGVPALMPDGPVDAIVGAAQNGSKRLVSAGDTPLNKTV